MTKRCVICGEKYETNRKDRLTCGSEFCKHEQHKEYLRIYAQNRRRKHRVIVNEYNRLWMADYRLQQKLKKEPESNAEGYAEKQMAKTLQMVEKILEL